jgi:excisionase family DNA binding protein
MTNRPFTPETLAERWGCSAEKIRQMFHRGEIAASRLGKLIRIPAIEVERIECLSSSPTMDTNSFHTVGNLPSRLDEERLAAEYRLARMMRA